MFKRSAIIWSVITMFCFASPVTAKPAICDTAQIQAWVRYYQITVPAACRDDQTGDWGIKINFDNNNPYFDNEEDAREAICGKAIASCNATHGADVVSCLIAKDNHCGYNPCNHEWKPHCDSSNNCINAYTYCGRYLSGDCGMALMNCYYGDTSKCQFLYSTCRLRSCEETWDPFCDAYNNCYISYKYCNHLSSDCASAMFWCYYTNMKDKNACDFIFGQCGVPEPR